MSILIMVAASLKAQSPQSINYQTVVRDASGVLVANQNISLQLSLLQGSATGTAVYTETHKTMTNDFGLATLQIGRGLVSTGTFSAINWANGPYYMQISLDITGGTNYVVMGTAELVSVPYALYAETAGNANDADADPSNEIQLLSISGDTIFLSGGGYVVLPQDTVSGGTNLVAGNNISISNDTISATTSFVEVDGDTTNELQWLAVDTDSLYINMGNAVPLSAFPGPASSDTMAIIANANRTTWIGVGLPNPNYNDIVFTSNGNQYFAMRDHIFSIENTGNSVFIGSGAGFKDDLVNNFNVCVGRFAGHDNISGTANVSIGSSALRYGDSYNRSVAVGSSAMRANSGNDNTAVGYEALLYHQTGNHNVALGSSSMYKNDGGAENIAIGPLALYSDSVGSGNVAIGFKAGYYAQGSNKLYIENSNADSTAALIYGEFDNNLLRVNGTVHINDVMRLEPRNAAPLNPTAGEMYFDATTNKLRVYDGTTWQDCW